MVMLAKSSRPTPNQPRLLYVNASHKTESARYILRRITGREVLPVVTADSRGTVYRVGG